MTGGFKLVSSFGYTFLKTDFADAKVLDLLLKASSCICHNNLKEKNLQK